MQLESIYNHTATMKTVEIPPCFYITPKGGCKNHLFAMSNAKPTMSVLDGLWSCDLKVNPHRQRTCPGFKNTPKKE
jgi:hypothetical protein